MLFPISIFKTPQTNSGCRGGDTSCMPSPRRVYLYNFTLCSISWKLVQAFISKIGTLLALPRVLWKQNTNRINTSFKESKLSLSIIKCANLNKIKDAKTASQVRFPKSELWSSMGQPHVWFSLPSACPCRPKQLLLTYKANEIYQINLIHCCCINTQSTMALFLPDLFY